MNKKLLLLITVVITLIGGCSTKNDLPVEGNQGVSTDNGETIESQNSELVNNTAEESRIEEGNKSLSNSMKLNFIKTFEGTGIWELSENRFLIQNGHQSAIYNENFELIKEVGDITIERRDMVNGFEYYFVDGNMKSKAGLMDFDGNILYESQFIDGNEEIYEEMENIIDSLEANRRYTYSREDIIAGLKEDGKYGLVRIQTYPEGIKVLETLIEPIYDELEYDPYAFCDSSTESGYCEFIGANKQNINSMAFKMNDKWGIIDFKDNILLDAEYGEISKIGFYLNWSKEDPDYYKVIDESGKLGIFSTEEGWIIEPQFNYKSDVAFLTSYITIYDEVLKKKFFYDKKGNKVNEFDDSISFKDLQDQSVDKMYSSNYFEFENSKTGERGIMNLAFEVIPLPNEVKYNQFRTLGDRAFLCEWGEFKHHVISLDGELIGEIGPDTYPLFINNKYIFSNMSVYELCE